MIVTLRRVFLQLSAEPSVIRLLAMVLAFGLALSRTSPCAPFAGGGGI